MPGRFPAPPRPRTLEPLEPRMLLAASPAPLPAPPPEAQVNTFTRDHQRNPTIAVDADGDYVVAWQSYQQDDFDWNIYAQRYRADGTPRGGEFLVNQDTSTYHTDPSVASDSAGNFVITWTQGVQGYVFARQFKADGTPATDEFVVDWTPRAGTSSVAMDDQGDYVIAWDIADQSDDRRSVFVQRFTFKGWRFEVVQVNSNLTGSAWEPDVAMDPNGDFAVAFEVGDDPVLSGSYVRRYDKSGVALLPEMRLSAGAVIPTAPAVSMADDGRFVVAWGEGDGVHARLFQSLGFPGGDILVGAATNPDSLDVAADAGRNFVVTWSAPGTGGQPDVFARGYAADGTALSGAFRVNSYVTSQQSHPAVATTPAGGFVAAWDSWGQDGDLTGVFARRFQNTLAPASSVVSRRVFYNRSTFDGNNLLPSAADDAAIATNKTALLPGGTASFLNVTSYMRGINGVMVDLVDVPGTPSFSSADFSFRSGVSADPSTWSAGPTPFAITTRLVAPGRYRASLVWRDYNPQDPADVRQAVGNGWLQVTVNANSRTNLAADDVFYFGNVVGETGGTNAAGTLAVTATDMGKVRAAQVASAASVNSLYDFNRDGRVNVLDLNAARSRGQVALPLLAAPRLAAASVTAQGGATTVAPDARRTRGAYLTSILG